MMQYLNDLRSIFLEGPEVCQNEAACDQDYQHDDELEEGVQGIGKNLCCSQAQGLYQITLSQNQKRGLHKATLVCDSQR